MLVSFQLTMPNIGSWNGRWTGEGNKYYVIRHFRSKGTPYSVPSARIKELLKDKTYANWHYSWNDGWGANVKMEIIDSKEASKRRKESKGFCGYEWMIDSILKYGAIYASHQIPKETDQP